MAPVLFPRIERDKTLKNNIITVLTLLAVAGTGFSASAQPAAETERSIEAERQRQEAISEVRAADGLAVTGQEVSYEDVLKDPDNAELNILYARGQIAKGNLTDAQAALERVLLSHPELNVVRMLYGLVLFRLDNLADAKNEFNALLESDISNADKVLVGDYLAQIADREKRTSISITVGMGVHYDDNRNSATRTGNLSLVDVTFASGIEEESDIGTMVTLSGEGRYDLGFQHPQDVYGKVAILGDQQVNQETLNLMMGRVDIGTAIGTSFGKVDLSANFSDINLNRKAYMTSSGLRASWDANPGEVITPYVEMNYQYQFYNGHQGATAAPLKTGNRWDAKVGARTYSLIENGITGANVSVTRKQARANFNNYDGYGLTLEHTQVFEKGRFLLGQVSYNNDLYAIPDPFIDSTVSRHDRRYRASVTGGAPLGSFADDGTLPDALNDLMMTATVERSDSRSNIVNYDYNNWHTQMMFSKTIRF